MSFKNGEIVILTQDPIVYYYERTLYDENSCMICNLNPGEIVVIIDVICQRREPYDHVKVLTSKGVGWMRTNGMCRV